MKDLNKNEVVRVRCRAELKAAIERRADALDIRPSDYVRAVLQEAVKRDSPPEAKSPKA